MNIFPFKNLLLSYISKKHEIQFEFAISFLIKLMIHDHEWLIFIFPIIQTTNKHPKISKLLIELYFLERKSSHVPS